MKKIAPPFLKPNDTIGICCPSGYLDFLEIKECLKILEGEGYKIKLGQTVQSASANYFSGTDEERLQDLQQLLDDENIRCILFGRGGYGLSSIIDDINWNKFLEHPKWICGFSDITLLHTHINTKMNVCSLHSPMAKSLLKTNEVYKNYFLNVLQGKIDAIEIISNAHNKLGKCKGELVGGNLCLIAHGIGSRSEINTQDKILFLEDIDEQAYQIDRMLFQLKRANKLECLKGLIIGGFSGMKDTTRPFGRTLYEIILNISKAYHFPIAFDFPIGHDANNASLIVGAVYELDIQKNKTQLRNLA